MKMGCNLVVQSARYGYNNAGGEVWADVTAVVSQLLANQYQQSPSLDNFSLALTAAAVGQLAPPAGVTPAVALTFYWQERGQTWTCTSSWAIGQTVSIPVVTPPQIVSAVYSSPNVTVDITSRLQPFVSLHTGPGFQFTVGSNHFLRSLFGTVSVNGATVSVDPDVFVLKSLYVKYSVIVGGQSTEYATVATDGQALALI
jgi:hypothetical protein